MHLNLLNQKNKIKTNKNKMHLILFPNKKIKINNNNLEIIF